MADETFESKQDVVENTEGIPSSVSVTDEGDFQVDTGDDENDTGGGGSDFEEGTTGAFGVRTPTDQAPGTNQTQGLEVAESSTDIDTDSTSGGSVSSSAAQQQAENIQQKSQASKPENPPTTTDEAVKRSRGGITTPQRAEAVAQAGRIQQTPEETSFRTASGETITREQALQQTQRTRELQSQTQQQIQQQRQRRRQQQAEISQTRNLFGSTQRNNVRQENNLEAKFGQIRRDQNLTFQPIERPGETLRDTVTDPAEQSIVSGVELMQRGQRFGEGVSRDIEPEQGIFRPSKSALPDNVAQEIDRLEKEAAGGAATLGTQAGGLAVATPGALSLSFSENTPSIQEGVAFGATETARQVKEDPLGFAAEEGGEEIGEAVVGGLIAGPAGLALSATPTPEIEVSPTVRATAETPVRLATGNLGTRATETEVRSVPATEAALVGETPTKVRSEAEILQEIGVSQTTERSFEPTDQGGRIQTVERIQAEGPTGQPQVTRGVRVEEPVTRTQFVRERLGLQETEVSDFLNNEGNALGLGPGGLVPPESEPEVEPETEPDTNTEIEQDIFQETEPEPLTSPSISRPGPVVDTPANIQEQPNLDQQIPRTTQNNIPGIDEINIQENNIDTSQQLEPDVTPQLEQIQQLEQRPRIEPELERSLESERTLNFLGTETDSRTNQFSDQEDGDQQFNLTPTLDAVLTGETRTVSEQEFEELQQQTFTGLETREIIRVENGDSNDLNNQLGI